MEVSRCWRATEAMVAPCNRGRVEDGRLSGWVLVMAVMKGYGWVEGGKRSLRPCGSGADSQSAYHGWSVDGGVVS